MVTSHPPRGSHEQRNREVLAHVALALSRYEKETKREGVIVRVELTLLRVFVMDCATPRQDATPLGDGEDLVDGGSMTNHPGPHEAGSRGLLAGFRADLGTADRQRRTLVGEGRPWSDEGAPHRS